MFGHSTPHICGTYIIYHPFLLPDVYPDFFSSSLCGRILASLSLAFDFEFDLACFWHASQRAGKLAKRLRLASEGQGSGPAGPESWLVIYFNKVLVTFFIFNIFHLYSDANLQMDSSAMTG